jgi:aminopeptidase N
VVSNGVLKEKNVNAELLMENITWTNRWVPICWWLPLGNLRYTVKSQNTELRWNCIWKRKTPWTTYRYSSQIFNFLEAEIEEVPLKIYKQIPVRDFLYAGMENTSATLFASRYIVDSIGFEDRNYINVNARISTTNGLGI